MRLKWVPILLLLAAVLAVGTSPQRRDLVRAVQEGDALIAGRRYAEALGAYEAAAARCPGCPLPCLRQGRVYVAQGRYVEAQAAYLRAVQMGGLGDETREALAELYVQLDDAETAIDMLRDLIARRPGRAELWLLLGRACGALGSTCARADALDRALDLGLDAAQGQAIHLELAFAVLDVDPARALDHLARAAAGPDADVARRAALVKVAASGLVEDRADPVFLHAKLGEALYRAGNLDGARRELERAVALAPTYVDAYAYLGQVLSAQGEAEGAARALERAIALEPDHVLALYFLGTHHVRAGRTSTGRGYLVRAYELDPANPAICAAIGESFLRDATPSYAVAERWLHAAVGNAPDDVRFHLLLAHFYVDMLVDPAVRGVAVAQVAVDLAPDSAEAHEVLGWARYLAGEPAAGLAGLERARELDPWSARVRYRLGEVYRSLGRPGLAREAYVRATDLDWGGPMGERARRALAELGD